MTTTAVSTDACAEALAALRARSPLVQCLTNVVAAEPTANALLALGASPAMVDNAEEAGPFAAVAGAVLVNLGTPHPGTAEAMRAAVASASRAGTPWTLDPVAVGALSWRTDLAAQLLATASPAVIRGNASEILALGGGGGGRGVDSLDTPEAALDTARALATAHQTTVAVSGPIDLITDGHRVVRVANGHPLLTRVTGTGCALGALMAAFTASHDDPLVAATSATVALTVAAEIAAPTSAGPGSLAVALLDELARLTPSAMADRANLG